MYPHLKRISMLSIALLTSEASAQARIEGCVGRPASAVAIMYSFLQDEIVNKPITDRFDLHVMEKKHRLSQMLARQSGDSDAIKNIRKHNYCSANTNKDYIICEFKIECTGIFADPKTIPITYTARLLLGPDSIDVQSLTVSFPWRETVILPRDPRDLDSR